MRLPRHCSDELLLSHLDGELSPIEEKAVEAHLKSCWECRARGAELDRQAQAISTALAQQTFPGPDRIAAARSRYLAWEAEYERRLGPAPNIRLFSAACSPLGLASVGLVGIAVLVFAVWTFLRPSAADVLAGVRESEQSFYQTDLPIHQIFEVEIAQVRPKRKQRTGRLEVWSESSGRRFAARWRDPGGELRNAVWLTSDGHGYVYDPAMAPGVARIPLNTRQATRLYEFWPKEAEMDQLEAAFLSWLRSRDWKPLAVSSEFGTFAAEDGVVLKAQRFWSDQGEQRIRLSALRTQTGMRVEAVLEMDAVTYRTRIHTLRFESGDQAVELRLTVERDEIVPAHTLRATVFQPDFGALAPRPAPAPKPAPLISRPDDPGTGAVVIAEPAELAEAELEAWYLLHRSNACLGEPVEVVSTETGKILVRGFTASSARKDELLAAFSELQEIPSLTVEISTFEEAMKEAPAPATQTEWRSQVHVRRLPIQDLLENNPGMPPERVARVANEAVALSDTALVHAWALQRLAGRYAAENTKLLRPRFRWLLEVMFRDHLDALRQNNSAIRGLLMPVLFWPAIEPPPREYDDGSWRQTVDTVSRRTERVNVLVHGLLAGAGLPDATTAESADALRSLLDEVDHRAKLLEAQVASEISGRSDSAVR